MGIRVSRYSQNTRDANETAIVKTLERLGGHWYQAPPLDGWVLWRGLWKPAEIKMPEREGLKYEYTASQQRFLRFAAARGGEVLVLRTDDDVIAALAGRRSA
jgi:hypothetical protein